MRPEVRAHVAAGPEPRPKEDARRLDRARREDDAATRGHAEGRSVAPAAGDRYCAGGAGLDDARLVVGEDARPEQGGAREVSALHALLALGGPRLEAAAAALAVDDVAADGVRLPAELLRPALHRRAVAAEEAVRRGGDGEMTLDAVHAREEGGERDGLVGADCTEHAVVGVLREAPHDGAVDHRRSPDAPALEHRDHAPAH